MSDLIIRINSAAKILGVSRTSLYNKTCKGGKYFDPTFPGPIQVGVRSVGFWKSEVEMWIRDQRKA